jgi:hypothetical protein
MGKFLTIKNLFLVPIILVMIVSIIHVISWYELSNPTSWAIFMSISIEIGAMAALVAATNKIKGGVWFMFGLITLIQMIGNIFYSYKEIDQNGDLFKSWVELTGPIWEMIGSDTTDVPAMKRWLAFLEGGLLPIISLTSLHFFVKYDGKKEDDDETPQVLHKHPTSNDEVIDEKNVEKLTDLQKESNKVWEKVSELREEGKLPTQPTEKELEEEPTALAFTPYDIQEEEYDEQPVLVEEEHPENEIIIPNVEEPQTIGAKVGSTLGDELNNTWKKIIKRRNNDIGRI